MEGTGTLGNLGNLELLVLFVWVTIARVRAHLGGVRGKTKIRRRNSF